MRQIVLDTETTGFNPETGDRVIEIGAIELVDRKPTGQNLHFYINPDREIPEEALKVHGITQEFLLDKPRFYDIAEQFMTFINGAELIIHNAEFDVNFLNHELSMLWRKPYGRITDYCKVVDTLILARQLHPGQRNSLDALCKRYSIKNSHRTLHGALLDAEILMQLYLTMTGGQEQLFAMNIEEPEEEQVTISNDAIIEAKIKIIRANTEELNAHDNYFK